MGLSRCLAPQICLKFGEKRGENMAHLQKFHELKRVLLLQKDRLQLCNLDTEYIDRAIKIAGELEDWSMDIVDIPLVDIFNPTTQAQHNPLDD